MAVSGTQPVVVPENYYPAFKVDVLLHAPIQVYQTSESDLHIELLMLCNQLDTICKQGLSKSSESKRTSILRNSKATMVYNNMQQVLLKLLKASQTTNSIQSFPQGSGLNTLFPRVAAYLAGKEHLIQSNKSTAFDDYLMQFSAMHHILSLSKQIHEEVIHQSRPKYLAYQLASLYQAIGGLPSGEKTLARQKKNLEENFPVLKTYLSKLSDDCDTELASEVREWVLDFCDSLIQEIRSMPKSMTEELLPMAQSFQ